MMEKRAETKTSVCRTMEVVRNGASILTVATSAPVSMASKGMAKRTNVLIETSAIRITEIVTTNALTLMDHTYAHVAPAITFPTINIDASIQVLIPFSIFFFLHK